MAEEDKQKNKVKVNINLSFLSDIKNTLIKSSGGKIGEEKVQVQEEDSVKEDFKKLKLFFNRYFGLFSAKTKPVVDAGVKSSEKAVGVASKVIDVSFTRKIVKIFIVFLLILAILFVAKRLFKNSDETELSDPVGSGSIQPTVPPYKPQNPSIYAEDKEVLKIEEDARVLLNEISGEKIEDSSLKFPEIDLNISFTN